LAVLARGAHFGSAAACRFSGSRIGPSIVTRPPISWSRCNRSISEQASTPNLAMLGLARSDTARHRLKLAPPFHLMTPAVGTSGSRGHRQIRSKQARGRPSTSPRKPCRAQSPAPAPSTHIPPAALPNLPCLETSHRGSARALDPCRHRIPEYWGSRRARSWRAGELETGTPPVRHLKIPAQVDAAKKCNCRATRLLSPSAAHVPAHLTFSQPFSCGPTVISSESFRWARPITETGSFSLFCCSDPPLSTALIHRPGMPPGHFVIWMETTQAFTYCAASSAAMDQREQPSRLSWREERHFLLENVPRPGIPASSD